MNEAHFHLILNHIPILGSIFGFLTLGVGLLRKNISLIQWGLVVFVVVMVMAILTFLTGDGAEEVVEDLPGISHALIKEHEEAADLALWSVIGLGVLSIVSIVTVARKYRYANLLTKVAFFLSLLVVGLMVWTGYLGGQIQHSEFNQKTLGSLVNIRFCESKLPAWPTNIFTGIQTTKAKSCKLSGIIKVNGVMNIIHLV